MSEEPRAFPHSLEAERLLLSQCMQKPELLPLVHEHVSGDDFYRYNNGRLFVGLAELYRQQRPIDPMTFPEELVRIGIKLDEVGGITYVIETWDLAPSTMNWMGYAGAVKDTAKRRRLITTMQRSADRAYDLSQDADQALDDAMGDLGKEVEYQQRSDHGSLDDALLEMEIEAEDREARGHAGNLRTGLRALDDLVALYPGDLVILLGHPSHAKTALALAMIGANVDGTANVKVGRVASALISMEMERTRIARRLVQAWSQVEGYKERLGRLSPDEAHLWAAGVAHYRGTPLRIHHGSALTINQISAWCHHVDRQYRLDGLKDGLQLVVVDYLQLMGQADPRQDRQQAVAAMARGLKALAGRLGAVVLALAQPNRVAMGNQDKRPKMHQIRESGEIEAAADTILAVYYHAKTVPDTEYDQWATHFEVDVEKQRDGGTGRALLHFQPEFTRFRDLTESEYRTRTSPKG